MSWLEHMTSRARAVIAGHVLPDPASWPNGREAEAFQTSAFPTVWAHSTMPKVAMGHRMAASLMATTVPLDQELVIPPWPSFAIMLPTELIPTPAEFMATHPADPFLTHVFVACSDESPRRWSWMAVAGKGQIYRHFVTTAGLVEHTSVCTFTNATEVREQPVGGEVDRLLQLVGRLIAGICLRLSNQDTSRPVNKGGGPSKRLIAEPPMPWTVQLTGDVVVDCREAVRDYQRGGGKSPTVQCLVRGHWKRQVCGVAHAERRWVHVEPYWRGPEEEPVTVRRHVLQPSA